MQNPNRFIRKTNHNFYDRTTDPSICKLYEINMMTEQFYVGIEQDDNEGLTHLGRVVRDAWMFGILPETETCAGWSSAQMQSLYEKVYASWEPYAHLPSRLPDDLRDRHERLYALAITNAKKKGWDAELDDED
jgi:hypothetical protein